VPQRVVQSRFEMRMIYEGSRYQIETFLSFLSFTVNGDYDIDKIVFSIGFSIRWPLDNLGRARVIRELFQVIAGYACYDSDSST
jgi:hypothetical protein